MISLIMIQESLIMSSFSIVNCKENFFSEYWCWYLYSTYWKSSFLERIVSPFQAMT